MILTHEQAALLAAPLSREKVKKNPRGFSYIAGWHAIAEANRIFGFDAWDRTVCELKQLGEPREVNGNQRISYLARVRITVRGGGETITRDGCGYGSGIDKDIGQAHESAIKEAETDAMKRALMTFGNPFGLALYDTEQTNVADAPRPSLWVTAACAAITCLNTEDECAAWYKANVAQLKEAPQPDRDEVMAYLKERKTALKPLPAPEPIKPPVDPFDDEIPF